MTTVTTTDRTSRIVASLTEMFDIADADRLQSILVYATAEYRAVLKSLATDKDLRRAQQELNSLRMVARDLLRDMSELGPVSRRFVQMADSDVFDEAYDRVAKRHQPASPEDPLLPSELISGNTLSNDGNGELEYTAIRQEYIQKALLVLEKIAVHAANGLEKDNDSDRRLVALKRWVWLLGRFWTQDLKRELGTENLAAGEEAEFNLFLRRAAAELEPAAMILLPYATDRYLKVKAGSFSD